VRLKLTRLRPTLLSWSCGRPANDVFETWQRECTSYELVEDGTERHCQLRDDVWSYFRVRHEDSVEVGRHAFRSIALSRFRMEPILAGCWTQAVQGPISIYEPGVQHTDWRCMHFGQWR